MNTSRRIRSVKTVVAYKLENSDQELVVSERVMLGSVHVLI